MSINIANEPVEGRPFRFNVTDLPKNVRVLVSIDGTLISDTECPDPPCHEMIRIPQNTARQMLHIEVVGPGAVYDKMDITILPGRRSP